MNQYPIKSISFENYKAFKSRQKLELKSLTLLFGYNNTGKSAAIRLLPLLAKSFQYNQPLTYTKSYLNYAADCVRGATFKDLSHGNQNKMSFCVEWVNGTSVDVDIKQDGIEPEVITSYKAVVEGAANTFNAFKFVQHLSEMETQYEDESDPKFLVEFNGFYVEPVDKSKLSVFETLSHQINSFSNCVHWLNSVRVHPPREFAIGAGIDRGVKFDGRNTAETLWFLAENKMQSFEEINSWLAETCGRKIDISSVASSAGENGRRTVKLETISVKEESGKGNPIRIPILDSGEGIAQALPAITLCAQAANGELGHYPIIAIEQPELHLHPRATVALANFLVRCINKNKNVRFVIETHSESFLLALQTALVEEKLLKNEIACYWVDGKVPGEGSTLTNITFDEQGYISENWPDEVFNETINQARELLKLRGID